MEKIRAINFKKYMYKNLQEKNQEKKYFTLIYYE
jgi:hypothetical protein